MNMYILIMATNMCILIKYVPICNEQQMQFITNRYQFETNMYIFTTYM